VDGGRISSPTDVIAAVEKAGVGRSLRLKIVRGGMPLEVTVMPGDLANQGGP